MWPLKRVNQKTTTGHCDKKLETHDKTTLRHSCFEISGPQLFKASLA